MEVVLRLRIVVTMKDVSFWMMLVRDSRSAEREEGEEEGRSPDRRFEECRTRLELESSI